ncbi:MAG TPA: DUF937 domain-containing protein [Acidobacteriota bacterium]|nr:DUF937 domain-containing protein [Acidobacteriota bacterium]
MQILMRQLSGDGVKQISQQIGADEGTTNQAIGTALPVLISALARNSSQPSGAEDLHRALQNDHDGSILDNVSGYLGGNPSASNGAAILGHVLGSRQDNVTNALAQQTGLNTGSIAQLLKMLAPMVMGALGKTQSQSGFDPGSLSGYLNGQRQQAESASPDMMGMLTSLLDSNKDGSVLDDLGNIASKFLKNQH